MPLRRKVIFGLIGSLSLILSFILIGGPYYYWLGQEHYAPKTNPDAGFVLPQTPEAWTYFVSGVLFLGVSVIAFVRFRQTEPTIKHVI
jgi:hypothetical protein